MSKHRISITLLIAIFAALALSSTASARSAHKYSAKELNATLSTDDGYPGVGGTAVLAGTLKSSVGGAGAIVDRVQITGIDGNVVSFIGGEVDYLDNGTWRSMFAGTATIGPDGSQALQIEGRYVGGTGRYSGLRGHYRFAGTAAPGATSVSGQSHGTLTY